MFAVGAGANVNVNVPFPLFVAIGPAFGSQPQKGPVNLTSFAVVQTVVVITKSVGTAG